MPQPSSTEARYAFLVEWYDPTASLIRQYQLIYYASDGTLEMVGRARGYTDACAPALLGLRR